MIFSVNYLLLILLLPCNDSAAVFRSFFSVKAIRTHFTRIDSDRCNQIIQTVETKSRKILDLPNLFYHLRITAAVRDRHIPQALRRTVFSFCLLNDPRVIRSRSVWILKNSKTYNRTQAADTPDVRALLSLRSYREIPSSPEAAFRAR